MKSAIVAGGGSGIGLAAAARLVDAGWAVTLAGRRAQVLSRAAASLGGSGGAVITCPVDLGSTEGPVAMVERHLENWHSVNALVYAAGAFETASSEEVDATHWAAMVDVNLRGAALAAAAASRAMLSADGGRIVLISSINGFHSEPESLAYSAAKAGVASLARSIAVDLSAKGVICNAVSPGWVRTAMTEDFLASTEPSQLVAVNALGRAGEADEIASLIHYLVVDAPDFLTGANLYIDGGQTAKAPSL